MLISVNVFGTIETEKSKKNKYFSLIKGKTQFTYKRDKVNVNIVGKKVKINIVPLAPVNLPDKITNHMLVEFPDTYLNPQSRVVVFLKVPIEVGVFLEKRLIDSFGFDKPEFVLYGPVSGGVIARRIIGIKVDKDYKCNETCAIIPLRIKNYTSRVRRVSKLLIDSQYLDMYYGKNKVVSEMIKLDLKNNETKVRNLNKNYFKNMTKVQAKTQLLKREEQMEMKWGIR